MTSSAVAMLSGLCFAQVKPSQAKSILSVPFFFAFSLLRLHVCIIASLHIAFVAGYYLALTTTE
jgi:hypothetical protein